MGSVDWDCRLLFDPQHQRREFSVVCLSNDFPYRLFDNAKIYIIKKNYGGDFMIVIND